jgi:hypothetical protein
VATTDTVTLADAITGMTAGDTYYVLNPWSIYLTDTPSTFAQATTKMAIKKRAKLYAIQFQVSSTSADTDFTILSLQAKGQLIGRRLPSNWAN